ncbi:MAG TPA: metallophosphoesterase family protein [Clostridia bacterium]|nr:metallophosphoesterase family protein [Clostridia bacterium]
MHYARFSSACLGLALFAVGFGHTMEAHAAEQAPAKPFSIAAGPVLQCPTETSMRITWITERDADGFVEYGPMNGELRTTATSRHGLIDADQRLHSVLLEDLRPGTEYRYRVCSREIVLFGAYKVQIGEAITNAFGAFRTLDRRKSEFSFLVFNDIHDRAANIPELLQSAGPEPWDFVVLNGDIVSHLDDEKPVLAILDQAAKSFASRVPMFWIRGNHETRGAFARQLPGYIGLPQERYYYAFDHGPVHFVVLDSGEDKIDSHREYHGLVDFARYRRDQGRWLKAHVQTDAFRRAKYRVVISHMPFPYKNAADPSRYPEKSVFIGMADAYEQFGQTLEQAGIDLMLSGHMHFAEVIPAEPPRHSYPIVIGGGHQGEGRTLTRVKITGNALEAVLLRPDGSQAALCKVPRRAVHLKAPRHAIP